MPAGQGRKARVELRGERAHALFLSTTGLPANVFYPDSGRWLIRNGPGAEITLP